MAFLRSERNNWNRATKPNIDLHRIPPLPARIIMTDRADGTLWFLTYSLALPSIDGYGYIAITDQLPTEAPGDFHTYGPWDGPVIRSEPVIKLLIRGGYLGYEEENPAPWEGERSHARVFARVGVRRSLREIIKPSSFLHSPDMLAWDVMEASNG